MIMIKTVIAMRPLASIAAFLALLTTLALAPATLVKARDGTATPRASPGAMDSGMEMSGTGAAYLTIRNGGNEADRLVGGKTEVAQTVEIHEIKEAAGVMEMRPLAEGLEIPAGGQVALEPGGYHVMLIGLREDLRNGMTFDLTLEFEHAGEITIPVPVRPRAELAADATPAAPLMLGELTIEGAWSRPAPALRAMGASEVTPGA